MPVPLRTPLLSALAVLASIAVTGCGSTRSAPPSSAAASSVPASSAAVSSALRSSAGAGSGTQPADHLTAKIDVALADSGRSIQVRLGDELVLTLSSSYWHLQAPQPANVLTLAHPSSRVPRPTPPRCPPGQGCGAVLAVYTANQPGRATITANRTSCGEARRCTPRQAHFQLTVTVNR